MPKFKLCRTTEEVERGGGGLLLCFAEDRLDSMNILDKLHSCDPLIGLLSF